MRRFQKIDVNEPTIDDAIEILKGLKPYYEEFHKLRYTDDAIKAAVELSAKLHQRPQAAGQGDRRDRRGRRVADAAARGQAQEDHRREGGRGGRRQDRAHPAEVGVQVRHARCCATSRRDLKRVVFGQDEAIDALASAIKLARAGLRDAEKPIGCYLFSGPTGVGKTEVAAPARAACSASSCCASTCREYMERHTVSRLIGAPPGYVGFDQGGLLTDGVDQHPHCGAAARRDREGAPGRVQHPAAGHGPRQADRPQRQEGRLPQRHPDHDHQRRRLRPSARRRSASAAASANGEDEEAIKRLFTPEFRNRLDAVIAFAPLPPEIIARWSRSSSCSSRPSSPTATSPSSSPTRRRDWLAENGYDELYGARPLARVIQEHIKKPLADEILFGKLEGGGTVRVVVEEKDGKKALAFEVIETKTIGQG